MSAFLIWFGICWFCMGAGFVAGCWWRSLFDTDRQSDGFRL